jgi:uncharacterized membrane protein YhaH (DUF805 family)
MNFQDSIKAYWRNYANFHGRTSKTTFWWTVLFLVLAGSLIGIVFPGTVQTHNFGGVEFPTRDDSVMQNVWSIATFLPSLALGVRRLQDIGKPGTYLWFCLLPIVGWIMLLVWFLKPGQPEANKDGEPVK